MPFGTGKVASMFFLSGADTPRRRLLHNGSAIIAIALATLLRAGLDPFLRDSLPFTTYYVAVMFVTWYADRAQALLATVSGGMLATYLFVAPRGSLLINGLEHQAGIVLYVAVCGVIINLTASRRRTEAASARLADTIRELNEQVAERKRIEKRMNGYVEALESANKSLEELNQVAESATRAKSEFLANMSHEIRTPMTAILGYADLMLEENVGPAAQEHLEVIKRNGQHLLALINDILDLSKVEAGKMQIEPARCSPFALLAEVVSLMRVRAAAEHLTLETEFVGLLPETIFTDPLRLRQVLVNLVGNAIKFTDQGGVRITARLTDNSGSPRLRFDVTDTGIGMNEEQVGRIFQAFSQVDNSSARKFGGTGLGLCISRRLVEAMGGNVDVHSTPGKGSTFSVTIDPGSLEGVRMIENAQKPPLAPPTTNTATPCKIELHGRVLLAEDGPDNQRLIKFLLKKAGADVTAVENGQLAVDAALASHKAGQTFDVILMDMQMPIMDGYEATRQLRERAYSGAIVALTANAMVEDRQKCLDAGCDDFTTKPIDKQKLLAVVEHWTARGRTCDQASKAIIREDKATAPMPAALAD